MKSTLKIGLLTGFLSCVFLFGFFSLMIWLNAKNGWGLQAANIRGIIGLISIPIQAIGIFLAMQNVRNLTGQLTYWQAVKTGLLVAITIAVVVAIFSFLYAKVLYPGFAEFMVRDAQKAMFRNGASQQDINQGAEKVRAQFKTSVQVAMALIGQFVTGAFISFILGLFTRSKNKQD